MPARTLFSRSAIAASFRALIMLPLSLSFPVMRAFWAPSSAREIWAKTS